MNVHYSLLPEAVSASDASTKDAILDELSDRFSQVYDIEGRCVRKELQRREEIGSTGFGRGVAIPHARVGGLERPVAAFLRLDASVDFGAVDAAPVNLVFGLLSPEQAGATHLQALASISRLVRDEQVHSALVDAPNDEALYCLLTNDQDRYAA